MGEKKDWVDFRAVKEAVNIDEVLEHYGLHSIDWAKPSDEERRGKCPFPGSNCKGARSFCINVKRNIFHCFSCKARGNVLDFVAKMEGCSIRDAGLKLASWFKVGESAQGTADAVAGAPVYSITPGLYCDPNPENPNLKYLVMGVARMYASNQEFVVYRELFRDYELRIQPKEDFLQLAKLVRAL